MIRATTKNTIAKTLWPLGKDRFEKFCFVLRDRRDDPRVSLAELDDASVETISNLLVSKFSAAKAVEVTIELLRDITCNSEADMLESRTRALLDKGHPTFRRTSAGKLDMVPSQEALMRKNSKQNRFGPVKTAQAVEAEAKECVRTEGGNPEGDGRLVLSRCKLQFGTYRDQTFMWLLENDLQYAVFIFTDSDRKKVGRKTRQRKPSLSGPQMDNKNSLKQYAMAFSEFRMARSLRLAEHGNARVGFGIYQKVKLLDLYQDPACQRYVDFLRRKESVCPGSLMEVAIHYILHCDQHGV